MLLYAKRSTLYASPPVAHRVPFTLMLASALWSAVALCAPAAEPVWARLNRDYAAVWRASLAVLQEWPLLDADEVAGTIRTGWREERQPKRWDRLLTQRDHRHRLELELRTVPEGTEVSVALRTQSRPMGRYSAPWREEAASGERVHALLAAIEQKLDGLPMAASP